MPKFEVVRPWYGVKKGDVIERDEVPRAIRANVRPLAGQATLVPATKPRAEDPPAPARKDPPAPARKG